MLDHTHTRGASNLLTCTTARTPDDWEGDRRRYLIDRTIRSRRTQDDAAAGDPKPTLREGVIPVRFLSMSSRLAKPGLTSPALRAHLLTPLPTTATAQSTGAPRHLRSASTPKSARLV